MKKRIKSIITNPLFSGSVVMIVGSNATNFLNYIYHLIMGRLLGPANYGELSVLFSLLGLFGIITGSLGLVMVKFVSASKTKEEISELIFWINKKTMFFSILLALVLVILSPFITSFLHIQNPYLIVLIAAIIVFSYPAFFLRSVLQGLLKFKEMIISVLVETFVKLILGVLLVYLGFSVGGAMTGLFVASVLAWVLLLYFIKDYLVGIKRSSINFLSMVKFSAPIFVYSAATTSLYSADIILVKHFFSAHDAGLYAALSTLGKIIFFATSPISSVMFPMISQRQARGEGFSKVFIPSLMLTLLMSLGVTGIFWLFPQLTIKMLYGVLYLDAAYLLIWFGIFMTLYSLSSLMINFYLSLGKVKVVLLPLVAAVLQVVGIWFIHDSLISVIYISIGVTTLLTIGLFVYFANTKDVNLGNSSSI